MATLTFTFDTGTVPLSKITDSFASAYSYQAILADGSVNPETKQQFARRKIKEYVIDIVKSEDSKAAHAAINISPINLT
jgi:hypothetical protein